MARRRLVKGQDTILETYWPNTGFSKWNKLYERLKGLSGRWITSQWKVPRYLLTSVIPTTSNSWRNAQPYFLECRAAEKGRQAFGTHVVYRETFLQIQMRHHQHRFLKNWINGTHRSRSRFIHPQWKRVKRRTQDQDQRCQSGPSAKNSVIFNGGDSPKN